MVVRPKRASPVSTHPVYLPRVPAVSSPGQREAIAPDDVPVFFDALVPREVEKTIAALARQAGRNLIVVGPLVPSLGLQKQTDVRRAVSSLAGALAWARIRDESKRDYRVLPLRGEVDAEEALYAARTQPKYGGIDHPAPAPAVYDASAVQSAFAALLARRPALIVTGRRLASWGDRSERWETIDSLSGNPAVISIAEKASDGWLLATLHKFL